MESLLTKYSCLEIEFSSIYIVFFFIFNVSIANNSFDLRTVIYVFTVDKIVLLFIIITVIILIYSRLLGIRWHSAGKSRPHQDIKAIYPSTSRMLCAMLISVICSSVTYGSPGTNWRFCSNTLLFVSNAPIITGTIFVLTFYSLLTSVSRSLYILSFSVSFVLKFESSGMAVSISRQVFSLFFIMQYCIRSVCRCWTIFW